MDGQAAWRHRQSPSELQDVIAAEREGVAFLIFRDGSDEQQIIRLGDRSRLTVGRQEGNDLVLGWDRQVSRVHLELEHVGGLWTVADEGLSSNGTRLNGARLGGRQRLHDGDEIGIGESVLAFRHPDHGGASQTARGPVPSLWQPNAVQKRVLLALCRPYLDTTRFATPATNAQIALEVHLSVDRVKAVLREIFTHLGLTEVPQNEKRSRLVHAALEGGLISKRDYSE